MKFIQKSILTIDINSFILPEIGSISGLRHLENFLKNFTRNLKPLYVVAAEIRRQQNKLKSRRYREKTKIKSRYPKDYTENITKKKSRLPKVHIESETGMISVCTLICTMKTTNPKFWRRGNLCGRQLVAKKGGTLKIIKNRTLRKKIPIIFLLPTPKIPWKKLI